jgi:hypothetical protein
MNMKDQGLSAGIAQLDGFNTPDRMKLLEIIDKFRELGLNEDLSLPQVGNQATSLHFLLTALFRWSLLEINPVGSLLSLKG